MKIRSAAPLLFCLLALACAAQEMVPRFELPASGLQWRSAATPLGYFDVTGRRAAIFGRQDGRLEAWVWPIKLLHGFRLEFRQQSMVEAVRGEALLREVITRPESTTLVYVHPLFTVRQIIWAPLNQPALAMFFDVDSSQPLVITAKFVPDLKPMWPASLGGQHTWWIAEDKAFGLGDAREEHVGIIGSPAAGAFTEFMDHSLIGGEMLLQMVVTPEQARGGLAALVMSLGMTGQQEARANYRNAVQHLRQWYEQKADYEKDFLSRTTIFETPDAELNRAFTWAKVAIDSGWVCTPVPGNEGVGEGERAGCGVVAGYGPAGEGERPGFAWWFGGDGLMASWAMEDYGDLPGALQELRFLKARQRTDGKIPHEIVQSLALVDWFGKFGFPYMHADTTPVYLYSLAQYWRRTGDRKFLEEFWPSAKKAYQWCVSVADPKDGLMDNTKAGLGAIEVGPLRGKVTKDIYLQGFWVAGAQAMSEMAQAVGDKQPADDAAAHLKTAINSLNTHWWNAEGKHFAFGVSASGERADMVGNWPAVLMALGGLDEAKARAQMERLALPDLATDWGMRTISNQSPLYDPVSYNNGTVWPFINTFASWAQYRWGMPLAGYTSLRDTANLTGIQAAGYMPEHMNGDRFLPGERSVPHQLFSSFGVLLPMIRGLLGVEVRGDTITLAPQLPANWDFVRFANVLVNGGKLSGEIRRQNRAISLSFDYQGTLPLIVEPRIELPLGARPRAWRVSGGDWKREEKDGRLLAVHLPGAVKGSITYEYEDGIGIVPPPAHPQAGERTSALKIIRASANGAHEVDLNVAGLGGRTYALELVTSVPSLSAEGASVNKTQDGYRLTIPFEGSGYVTREIRLRY